FRSPAVWLLCVAYFGLTCGNYGISFWLPQVIKDSISSNPLTIGWITAIPWAAAAVAMILVGRHSDATGERRWHFALSCLVVSAGFGVSAVSPHTGAASRGGIHAGGCRNHVRLRGILGVADGPPFRGGSGGGNRLDQFRRQPRWLCQSVH